jgi:hypothetical protein
LNSNKGADDHYENYKNKDILLEEPENDFESQKLILEDYKK